MGDWERTLNGTTIGLKNRNSEYELVEIEDFVGEITIELKSNEGWPVRKGSGDPLSRRLLTNSEPETS